jgi:hypothetical protein
MPECRSIVMKRRKSAPGKKRLRAPEAREDLSATTRALYGVEDEPGVRQTEPESVEDPLRDWPESAGEADHWARSRRVRRDEEREG